MLQFTLAATLCLFILSCSQQPEAPEPSGDDFANEVQRDYADCWAATAQGKPPTNVFKDYTAAILRCRHLAPPPHHYQKHDEQGEPVYRDAGGWKLPVYEYSTQKHEECLTQWEKWFWDNYQDTSPGYHAHFAEAVCATPR